MSRINSAKCLTKIHNKNVVVLIIGKATKLESHQKLENKVKKKKKKRN